MISPHEVTLCTNHTVLRPFRDEDLYIVLPWNNDPMVMKFYEGNIISTSNIEDIRPIYEQLASQGLLFIIETADGQPIGECCLQWMNLDWVKERYPGERILRLDIMIGERSRWGKGHASDAVALCLAYGFNQLAADRFFIPGVWAFNERSLRLWRRFGFQEVKRESITLPPLGDRPTITDEIHLTLTRDDYEKSKRLTFHYLHRFLPGHAPARRHLLPPS